MTESRVLKISKGYVPQVRVKDFLWFKKWVCISPSLGLYEVNDSRSLEYCVYEEEKWADKKLKEYLDKENDQKVLKQ